MIKLPINNQWIQPNNSDKLGSLAYTKNVNLDEAGYIKLSPRSVSIYDESQNADLGIPLAIGRFSEGNFLVGTSSDANFNGAISINENTWTENSGSNEPTMTLESHACWFNGAWHASTATAVLSRPSSGGATQAWTSHITGLTSGKRHYLAPFASRNTLCVTNGNVVKQYTSAYAASIDLTIPSDFEAIGLAYNNSRMAVLTRLGTSTGGQDQESRLFIWDGTTTGAQTDAAIGSDAGVAVCAYKSSFAILTRTGQVLYWNGGGFDQLAAFPFFFKDKKWGGLLTNNTVGQSMIADGDVIYINVGLELNSFGKKLQTTLPEAPSGVWCFDPAVGLYHRWSPSISKAYVVQVTDANVDIGTDTLTATSGTIPATGGLLRLSSSTNGIGGIDDYRSNTFYYVIKVSSTEFKIAATKADALAGTAIDLTSAGSGGLNYFWMYDIVDYGNTYTSQASTGAGAIGLVGETNQLYQDIIFGGDYRTTAGAVNDAICITVPFLENRGYIVTPKIFSNNVTDLIQKIFLRFRPLKSDDSIVVKYRDRDIEGVPVSSSGRTATWTSSTVCTTSQNLSEVKTAFDAGTEFEIEFISGAGGNQSSKIANITESGGTYTITTTDTIIGAAASRVSEYIINNWKIIGTATSADTANFKECPVAQASKFYQFKIEMRGSEITIEDMQFINDAHKPSV